MKKALLLLMVSLSSLTLLAQQAQNYELPNAYVYDMDGNKFYLHNLDNNGKPILIFTWSYTWCPPCNRKLNEFKQHYDKWKQETGLEIIALNVDKESTISKVKSEADRYDWPFTILADKDFDFMDKLGVTSAPLSLFLNKQLETVKSYLTYAVTPELFYGILINIDKKKQYFNKKWQFTTPDSADFYRIIKSDYSNFDAPFYVEDYYLNGQVQMKGNYSQLYPIGIQEGEFFYYEENGSVDHIANYIQGKQHGIYTQYFPSGKLNYEVEYKNDLPWNIIKYYDINGNALNKGTIINGNGKMFLYYDNGTMASEYILKDGLVNGLRINYNEQGVISQKIKYKDGIIDGLVEVFNENGNKYAERVFEQGTPITDWVFWDKDGNSIADIVAKKLETFDFEEFVENIDFNVYEAGEEFDALEDKMYKIINKEAEKFYEEFGVTEWENHEIFIDLLSYLPMRNILSTYLKYDLIKYYKPFDRIKYKSLVEGTKKEALSRLKNYPYRGDDFKPLDDFIETKLSSIEDEDQLEIAWTLVFVYLIEKDSRIAKYVYDKYL